jgi:hypothetical protein
MSEYSDNPVVLSNLLTNDEAAMLVAELESLGITARVSGAGGATGWPEAASYTQVLVRRGDLERARAAAVEMGLQLESDSAEQS